MNDDLRPPSQRKYGTIVKNPGDDSRCAQSVHGGGSWASFHQCPFKNGHGPKGLFCKIHDPARVEQRQKDISDRWNKKMAMQMAPYRAIEAKDAEIASLKKRLAAAEKALEEYRQAK